MRWAEVFCVLVCVIHCAMSIIFPSFSIYCCTWCSKWQFTLRKDNFSPQVLMNTCRLGFCLLGYHCQNSSTPSVALPLQNPYIESLSAYCLCTKNMFTVISHRTLTTIWFDYCTVCWLTYCCHFYNYIHNPYSATPANSVTTKSDPCMNDICDLNYH